MRSCPPSTRTPGCVEGWFGRLRGGASGNAGDDHPSLEGESPTFITALSDAYLVPREDLYAIFWRTAGRDLCCVEPAVAEEALRGDGVVVRLGSWSGSIRGRHDEWTLWWSGGLSWAATSDVADGDQTMRLIERWRAEAARAEARGQRWDPVPP
jgi:hypothetical protein